MKPGFIRTLLFIIPLAMAGDLLAAGPDGKTISLQGNGRGAIACSSCHGQQGEGNASAGYPYLAGLPAAYIENQLRGFKQGSRSNTMMQPMASSLSAQEITALADYYSGLDNPKLNATDAPPAGDYPLGAALARDGKWQAGVPGCFRCHGPTGQGVTPHFPPLVGQPYQYLVNQLQAWQKGLRHNDPLGLMQSVSQQLSRKEIEALGHYLATPSKQ